MQAILVGDDDEAPQQQASRTSARGSEAERGTMKNAVCRRKRAPSERRSAAPTSALR
jgi:hypothetical protein